MGLATHKHYHTDFMQIGYQNGASESLILLDSVTFQNIVFDIFLLFALSEALHSGECGQCVGIANS